MRNSSNTASASSSDGDTVTCTSAHCAIHPSNGSGSGGSGLGGSTVGIGGTISSASGSGAEMFSLWPDPENAHYLEIIDKVPVCVFGQPLAVTPSR